jgi:primosomal protein N' (replication factor Y)
MKYADIILPLALEKNYTFGIPIELQPQLHIGCRVEVQFGKQKMLTGIVKKIHDQKPEIYQVKPILRILDDTPIVTTEQLKLWEWMASYYMCTEGEVMNAALPSFFKLSSETFVTLQEDMALDKTSLTDDEYVVVEALEIRREKQQKQNKTTTT